MNTAVYNMFSAPQQQPVIMPFGPVVGRNSRERRRIRRAQERMQKALEAAATTVLTPSSLYPSATQTPAVPTQPVARGHHHHHQSVDWSRPAQRPIHHVRSRSTPSAACGDIRSLWAVADDAAAANGFPTAFSIPRRTNPVGTSPQSSRPSSIALLDCFDPEVDCLSDLDSLLWTAKATVDETIPELCHSPASSASGSSSLSSPPELHLPLPAAMYPTNTSKNAETAYFRSF
ncbi:hypothetical protein FS837_000017 [Tulasnella sp. UAMH 9824]|nr:hypothetical protein FS837_000017 [Tulasnella sp. UAMH 9824]